MTRFNIKLKALAFMAFATCCLCSNAQDNYLQCEGSTIARDEHKTVDIALKNAVIFSAFQCDITIPETVSFVDNEGIVKGSQRFAATHRIIEKKISDNALRVIVYSTDNSNFNNDAETLFSYTIAANNPDSDSSGQTTISNIIFSQIDTESETTNCIEHIFSDLTFNTAVSGIDAVNITELKIYASGMHIIVLSPSDTSLQFTNVAGVTSTLNVKAGKNTFDVPEPGVYIVGTTKVIVQ
ncbi:MAG: hypothetical protein ACI4AH_02460 [Muribaculaceae bacterium]